MESLKQLLVVALGCLAVLLTARMSAAATTTVPVSTLKVIARQDGDARVLLKADDLSWLNGRLVTSATLEVMLAHEVPEETLDVQVYAVSRAWDSNASWDTPWQESGGEWSRDYFYTERLVEGREAARLRFDVSAIVRAIAEGDAGNNGFILMPADHQNEGRFRMGDLELFGDEPEITLSVSHRYLGARARELQR